jgi:hypothetical protein
MKIEEPPYRPEANPIERLFFTPLKSPGVLFLIPLIES